MRVRCTHTREIHTILNSVKTSMFTDDCHATMGIDTSSAGAAAVAAVAFSPLLVLRAVADSLALGAASYTNKRSGLDAAFFLSF